MRWTIVKIITKIATDLSNILIRKRKQYLPFEEYAKLPKNSLGRNFYNYLKAEKIAFKPNLIRHDLKHILLGYEMKMPDELKINAFLLGNRYYNPLGITYLFICVLIVPEIIPELKKAYQRGRTAVSLKSVDLGKYLSNDLQKIRYQLNISPLKTH
jgi:ubiquinone biosynthesis protein Coq4